MIILMLNFNICQTHEQNLKMSAVSVLVSQWGFHTTNGGRPGAAKVMVVVTDGESHDEAFRDGVISECETNGITRFGIAVSDAQLYVVKFKMNTSLISLHIASGPG